MDEYENTQSPSSHSDDYSSSPTASMAEPTCSHCWHGLFYLAMSLTLAYTAFAATNHRRPENPLLPPGHGLAFNASRALRLRGGFHVIATLLQISPDLFLPGPESTIFAIPDSAVPNISVPPWAMRRLLRYHAAPVALPMAALRRMPPGFCFGSLVDGKSLAVTGNDAGSGSVAINGVPVSHPDLFLGGPLSVHGVSGPFDVDRSPPCDPSPDRILSSNGSDRAVQWARIIRLLTSNGFVSFAIGLNSVLDGIVSNLSRVSIFAPPNSGFIASSSPFLDKIVKIHILPQRFSYLELVAAENLSLRTLIPGYNLKIDQFSEKLGINGVEINKPDLILSEDFVIHGISREFDVVELFSSFM